MTMLILILLLREGGMALNAEQDFSELEGFVSTELNEDAGGAHGGSPWIAVMSLPETLYPMFSRRVPPPEVKWSPQSRHLNFLLSRVRFRLPYWLGGTPTLPILQTPSEDPHEGQHTQFLRLAGRLISTWYQGGILYMSIDENRIRTGCYSPVFGVEF